MREPVRRLHLFFLVGLICYAKAFADAGDPTGNANWGLAWLVPWVPVVSALLAIAQAVVARQLTSLITFWHTPLGHGLLTAFGALIGVLMSVLANGAFTKQALIAAIAAGIGAFGGAWKTGSKEVGKLPIPPVPAEKK